MAILSFRLRRNVPKILAESEKKQWVAGPKPSDLNPIFNEMLALEVLAFILTCVAALISAIRA